MKTFITTVAGCSTRFNKDLETPALKCIYFENEPKKTILYNLLSMVDDFDHIIVVGGYLYETLLDYSENNLKVYHDKITFVFNPNFKTWGSCYSFFLGLEEAKKYNPDEIVFAEGDLFFDNKSFKELKDSERDAISINNVPIEASKAVVAYVSERRHFNYVYDSSHSNLFISEPFISIYNSGQVWKFRDMKRLHSILSGMNELQYKGTNLEIISPYFKIPFIDDIAIIKLNEWINCNTVNDYYAFINYLK